MRNVAIVNEQALEILQAQAEYIADGLKKHGDMMKDMPEPFSKALRNTLYTYADKLNEASVNLDITQP